MQAEKLRSTASLIKSEGVWIRLSRSPEFTPDGAGGVARYEGSPTLLPAQLVFRAGQNQVNMPRGTEEGAYRGHEFVLVGLPEPRFGLLALDVKAGDMFQWDEDTYSVHSIHHDRTYQVKALCRVVGS